MSLGTTQETAEKETPRDVVEGRGGKEEIKENNTRLRVLSTFLVFKHDFPGGGSNSGNKTPQRLNLTLT